MRKKCAYLILVIVFLCSTLYLEPRSFADQSFALPKPGAMVNLSPAYQPVIIKGLTVHKDNPFVFDFIVDPGQDHIAGEPLKAQGEKLIKYFGSFVFRAKTLGLEVRNAGEFSVRSNEHLYTHTPFVLNA